MTNVYNHNDVDIGKNSTSGNWKKNHVNDLFWA